MSAMSSTRIATWSFTSPTITMGLTSLAFFCFLWIKAKSTFKLSAMEVTLLAPPVSDETMVQFLHSDILSYPLQDSWLCIQIIYWDIKKALHFRSMWFHGDDMVCTCYRQRICSKLGGHWGPPLALLILPGLREAWDDCSNQAGWGHLAGINHDQKLHWIFIDLSTTILHNIDIFFLHTLADFHAGPMFAEFLGHSLAQLQVQVVSTGWELPLKTDVCHFGQVP